MTKEAHSEEILDFAISKEEESIQFYTDLAKTSDKAYMKELFEQFAGEEKGHKKKLEGVKEGRLLIPDADSIMDLRISDYLVDIEPYPEMTYQEALIVAMKREKAAFKLYTFLADIADTSELSDLFKGLAQEEAKHKLRIEIEYDENILTEN